jgi:folylpolyglutamate synthase/dihydropteroate synthase
VILYGENPTLLSIAEERNSRVIFPLSRDVTTNLLGEHQISNARIAYEAGIFLRIDKEIIENALLHVDHHGRLEYLRPNLLIDGAHNEDGLKKLKYYLESLDLGDREVILCFNLKRGKSPNLVLDAFPSRKNWIIVDSSHQMVESA